MNVNINVLIERSNPEIRSGEITRYGHLRIDCNLCKRIILNAMRTDETEALVWSLIMKHVDVCPEPS